MFPYRHAERLVEILPNAELVSIADSYTYLPEDQPLVLARLIDGFIGRIRASGMGSLVSSHRPG